MVSVPADARPQRDWGAARILLLGLTLCFCAISLYLCHRAIRVMERTVTVMENIDAKLDRAITAAPSVIERGKQLAAASDAERLRAAARDKAAELSDRTRNWITGPSDSPQPEQ